MTPLFWVVGFLILQRAAELALAMRNTRRLIAEGASEVGAGHYPIIVAVHIAWLVSLITFIDPDKSLNIIYLMAFILLQMARVWVLATLGRFWTTRIIVPVDAPLVRRGPYRFLRHPNYWIVMGELAVVPMIFGNYIISPIFIIVNAIILRHRIKIEEATFSSRDTVQ